MMRFFTRKPKAKQVHNAIVTRGFAAAVVDRLIANWRYDGGYTPAEISAHLSIVRGRSREMAKDNPHAKKFLSLSATNIVGQGFSLKSQPHDIIKNQPVLDTVAAKFIEYHWRRFCSYRDPETTSTWFDLTGLKTEPEMDRMNVKGWARDGEYFIHIIRNAQNPYGIAFRVLRPDWCDHTYNMADTGRGTLIHAGVEKRIDTRRPVAYWFHSAPQSAHAYSTGGRPVSPIPAQDIIHGFTQEDEDQPRGIPWVHAGMVKLKMLEEYDKAEITAARDEACTVRSYIAEDGSSIDELIDLTLPENSEIANALTMEKNPGQTEIIPRGYKPVLNTPQHPNRELTAFKTSMLRDIATGFGVEYANFANDWAGVSFSSVRAGTIAERDEWIVLQDMMITQCKQVQFLVWLKSFLSLSISGNFPPSKIEKFSEHEFRGRRWMWVDPMKDMAAAVVAVNNGWKTNGQVASDLGTDYDDNLETLAREGKAREDSGLTRQTTPSGTTIILNMAEKEEEDEA